jgi:type IV secretion system protein VirB11
MNAAQPIAHIGARNEHIRRITEKLARELGPEILALLENPTVIEIMLNPDGSLWVEHLGEPMRRFGRMAPSQAESLMATVASTLKTQITAQNPVLECELPLDGSRFEALLPPVVSGPTFTIRKNATPRYCQCRAPPQEDPRRWRYKYGQIHTHNRQHPTHG